MNNKNIYENLYNYLIQCRPSCSPSLQYREYYKIMLNFCMTVAYFKIHCYTNYCLNMDINRYLVYLWYKKLNIKKLYFPTIYKYTCPVFNLQENKRIYYSFERHYIENYIKLTPIKIDATNIEEKENNNE